MNSIMLAEASGIKIEGENKWITVIHDAISQEIREIVLFCLFLASENSDGNRLRMTKKEFARVADEIYRSAKEDFSKDTGASKRFLEWISEFKV